MRRTFVLPRLFRAGSEGDCAICYESLTNGKDTLAACVTSREHVFHTECLREWCGRKATCPLCRGGLDQQVLAEHDVQCVVPVQGDAGVMVVDDDSSDDSGSEDVDQDATLEELEELRTNDALLQQLMAEHLDLQRQLAQRRRS